MTDIEIEKLLSDMTLTEKLAELTQLWGENPDGTLMGILHGFHKNPELAANAGSLLGFNGAERVIAAQQYHMEESAHHIPLLFMTDVIHGYRTIFPSVLAQGCSFDPELAESCARVAAAEAAAAGVHVTFSPMADLSRDARWGRVIESTGEDPYLNSLFSAAFTRGYQGTDFSEAGTIAACVKHFAGYGAGEGGRDYETAQIGEYDLYNSYLPAFQAAIEAGCRMLMPGFHTLNGTPCTMDRHLIKEILRDEMKFNGTVISDCTAVSELLQHGVCDSPKAAAISSLEAGVDIEMVSSLYFENLEKAVEEGLLSEELIDTSVRRVLSLKNELGLFEHPNRFADPAEEKRLLLCREHRSLARLQVQKSCVLLKNKENVLPLSSALRTVLIGPFGDSHQLLDIWGKVNGNEDDCITLKEALKDRIDAFSPGCALMNLREKKSEESFDSSDSYSDSSFLSDDDLSSIENAVRTASNADLILLAIGEHPDMSSEAGSRSELTLPENQLELLRRLNALGKKIVTILFCGRPLDTRIISAYSDALLVAWFPGTEGGNGIADLLTGAASPEGRLAMSFPYTSGQEPLYYNHLPTGRPNYSNRPSPFTSGYIDLPPKAMFPFGFGLTYTEFSYGPCHLSSTEIMISKKISGETELLSASARITNTGDRSGTETVQLYLQDVTATLSRPVRMLRGIRKVFLRSGASANIVFPILAKDLMYYIPGQGEVLEPGSFRVFIAPNSSSKDFCEFAVSFS